MRCTGGRTHVGVCRQEVGQRDRVVDKHRVGVGPEDPVVAVRLREIVQQHRELPGCIKMVSCTLRGRRRERALAKKMAVYAASVREISALSAVSNAMASSMARTAGSV